MPTLLRRLERAAQRDTTVTFVIGGEEEVVPWRELHAEAKGYAAALQARGAVALVHDPLFSDDELKALGFLPYQLGDPVDAAVVQADHADYRGLGPADLPGIKVFVDGRRVSSAERWPDVTYRVIGKP